MAPPGVSHRPSTQVATCRQCRVHRPASALPLIAKGTRSRSTVAPGARPSTPIRTVSVWGRAVSPGLWCPARPATSAPPLTAAAGTWSPSTVVAGLRLSTSTRRPLTLSADQSSYSLCRCPAIPPGSAWLAIPPGTRSSEASGGQLAVCGTGLGGRAGMRTRSTVSPGREWMAIVPPWRSTMIRCAMSSPRPVPLPTSLVV